LKALCVSDKVVERLYSPMVTTIAKDVDIIFGSGDLPYYYLEYLQSMLNVPLYYVHGNHDLEEEYIPSGDTLSGPRGGIDLDGRIEEVDGILIAGLQGSIRYKSEGTFQHTESEMWLKVFQMVPRLIYNQLTKGRALDVLITHSPPPKHSQRQRSRPHGFCLFFVADADFQAQSFNSRPSARLPA